MPVRLAILQLLVKRGHKVGLSLAGKWITGKSMENAVGAASAMFLFAADCGWRKIWPRFSSDRSFAELTLSAVNELRLPDRDRLGKIPARLSESQAIDLYIWLFKYHPPKDSFDEVAVRIGKYEVAEDLREAIIGHLRLIGTPEATEAIARAARELPQAGWLREFVHDASEAARRTSWKPMIPREILTFLQDPNRRLIQSERDLLDVVVESLERF